MARKKQDVSFDRVLEKLDEARFFLERMENHKEQWPEFGYYLSAFVSAFASIFYRLNCLGAGNEVSSFKESHKDVAFLTLPEEGARHREVHREGIPLVSGYEVSAASTGPWASSLFRGPFRGAFRASPWEETQGSVHRVWRFKHGSRDVIKLCRDALQATREFVEAVAPAASVGG